MQCARHPSTETELACGKCGTPICPRCLVYTPVGTRCPDCAQLRKLPQFEVSTAFLLRGLGAALGAGVALGAVWGVLLPFGTSLLFGLLVGLGVGYAVGEAVSVATNRKAAQPLRVVAAVGCVAAYVVRSAIIVSASTRVELRDLSGDVFGFIVVGLAVFVAMGRLR